MATVFISYTHDDAGRHEEVGQFAAKLTDQLGANSVFIDRSAIGPGQTWSTDINSALAKAQLLTLFTSSGLRQVTLPKLCDASSVVRRELDVARDRGITIMPIASRSQQPPGSHELPDDLQFLASLHWENLAHISLEECVRRTIQALAEAIVRDLPSTDLVARAVLRFHKEPEAALQAIARNGQQSDNQREAELASLAWLRLTKPQSLATTPEFRPQNVLVKALLEIRTFELHAAATKETAFRQRMAELDKFQQELIDAPLSQHLALTLATAYRLEYERAVAAASTQSRDMIRLLRTQLAAMPKDDRRHCTALRTSVVERVPWLCSNPGVPARTSITELSSPVDPHPQRKAGGSRTSATRRNAKKPGVASTKRRGTANKPRSGKPSSGSASPPRSRTKKGPRRPHGRTG